MSTSTMLEPVRLQLSKPTTDGEAFVAATINYYRDPVLPLADHDSLSEHEMRISRRRDDAPDVQPMPVQIRNMRLSSTPFTIEEHGFTLARLSSAMTDWSDQASVKTVYFPEVTETLKRITGAKHVFQYEHHIRRRTLDEALQQNSTNDVDINGPVRRLHIDETLGSARREFAFWNNDELLADRPFGIYNVWKPLKTVRKDPLCVCDARSLRDEDLRVGCVTVPAIGDIENYSIRAPVEEGRHQFWFQEGQRPDEALVFRIVDTRYAGDVHGSRRFGVAHTSFEDPATKNSPEARESVEVRSFCIF